MVEKDSATVFEICNGKEHWEGIVHRSWTTRGKQNIFFQVVCLSFVQVVVWIPIDPFIYLMIKSVTIWNVCRIPWKSILISFSTDYSHETEVLNIYVMRILIKRIAKIFVCKSFVSIRWRHRVTPHTDKKSQYISSLKQRLYIFTWVSKHITLEG